ncbi:MAG: nucleotidyltransferase family protein [Lysobacteraceae bacterium]
MKHPIHSKLGDDAIRHLAGSCYLALREEDGGHLDPSPPADVLEASGLSGMHANLCVRLGVPDTRAPSAIVRGMQLSATNAYRWDALTALLATLAEKGIEPVLFKGGALHARWPELRDLRAMADYDLIIEQARLGRLRTELARLGFEAELLGSTLTQRLNKGSAVYKGAGFQHQNLDIHARVTEPPVCSSLTRSILSSTERASGVRVPDIEDCVCMIALHIVRSGMSRPLCEYIDLLWYVDGMHEAQWESVCRRARRHHLLPALFLALRQALYCLALDELAAQRARALCARLSTLEAALGPIRRRALDWLAPPDYPLHPVVSRNRPAFRRSFILGAGTSSLWRVGVAFVIYGATRIVDRLTSRNTND